MENRFVLDTEARRRIIHGFRLTFEEYSRKRLAMQSIGAKLSEEAWWELQAVYRIAEALAEPKRGKRPHINRGYRWYFDGNLDFPLARLEKWEGALKDS